MYCSYIFVDKYRVDDKEENIVKYRLPWFAKKALLFALPEMGFVE